jgi:hypothetical protein
MARHYVACGLAGAPAAGVSTASLVARCSAQIRIGSLIQRQEILMLRKLLATFVTAAFTATAFAQAQPAEPKGQTGTETQKAQPAAPAKKQAKAQKKARVHKPVAKAKAKAKAKGDAKSEAGK